jgi:hypothetical protein
MNFKLKNLEVINIYVIFELGNSRKLRSSFLYQNCKPTYLYNLIILFV